MAGASGGCAWRVRVASAMGECDGRVRVSGAHVGFPWQVAGAVSQEVVQT